ncbi:MAG TPA: cupin domain-containing protein [Dongiaceae bacterium]|nr:cupin domain-containing protein [Dongiaceae bacterium]
MAKKTARDKKTGRTGQGGSPLQPQQAADYFIGGMIRQRRKELSLTLEAVASASGVAISFLSEIERDQSSPSVATLIKLCTVLGIPVGSLFQSNQAVVVRADARERMRYGGQNIAYELLTSKTATKLAGIWGQLEPGASSGADLHALEAEEQLVFVVDGTMIMLFQNEEIELRAGDSLTFDPRRPHRYFNPSKTKAATAICIITPQPR